MGLTEAETLVSNALMGAYVTQRSSSVDTLRFGCPQNHPLGAELAQKGHIRDGAPALRGPGKMLDMVASSLVLRQLTSEPSILDQTTNSKRWLGGLVISNIDNRR